MKRIISLILVLVLCLSLCACGGGNEESNADKASPETIDTSEPADNEDIAEPEESIETEETTVPEESIETEETTVPEETKSELIDGMRPEFKEAMDAYEAFYDEYCEFMLKYKKNPTDLTLLTKYSEMLVKLAEMDKAFQEWDEDEMNNAELKYYLDVSNRITKKLIDVAA